jgi:hypothetical protein
MSEQDNLETVASLYQCFIKGDVDGILARLTTDVKWVTHLDSVVPWSGSYDGREAVRGFFDAISRGAEVLEFTAGEYLAQGDTVISMGSFGCRARTTGKTSRGPWIFVWRFRGGQVCGYEQFHDHSLSQAFR